METFTQPKITGYRQLNETEAALMNEIKQHAEQTRELVHRVQNYLNDQGVHGNAAAHSTVTDPLRWVNEAMTDLQKGYMSLVRAVAQPTTF